MTGPQFLLRPATPAEIDEMQNMNAEEWGGGLDTETYCLREKTLSTTTLCRNGGISRWVLVNPSENPHEILSSCETIKKDALIARPPVNGQKTCEVVEVVAPAIGVVYTPKKHRGKKYASIMLRLLVETLERQDSKTFSVLFSDIGKKYYASHGWEPHPSRHIEFPAMELLAPEDVKLLHATDAPALCMRDLAAIREYMSHPAPERKTKIALVPDYKTYDWHWAREEFLAPIQRPKISIKPEVKGAMSTDGKRWIFWTRVFNKDTTQLAILRVVNHARSTDEETEVKELAKLFKTAAHVAQTWKLGIVTAWNPDELTIKAVRSFAGEHAKVVERDETSIPSIMMHDQGSSVDDVEWVANEKFEWC